MATYLVTSKVNGGSVQKGMSVLIETYQSNKPTLNDVIKAFKEQKRSIRQYSFAQSQQFYYY